MTTSLLGSLMQDTTGSTSHRIPMKPQGLKAWQIKHNAKDGTLSILLPDADENEDGRPTTIEGLTSASFVPVFAYRNAHGSIDDDTVGSNPSLSATRFDCYVYHHDNSSESLGIFTDTEIREEHAFGVGQRFFGFMTAIDGKNIAKDERFAKYLPENGIVFCHTQLTPYKLFQMVKALNLDYDKCNTQLINHVLTIEAKNKASEDANDYKCVNGKHVSWAPKFTMAKLSDTKINSLEKKAVDVFEPLGQYSKRIKENDEFLNELTIHGISGPNAVNNLDEQGIYDKKTLAEFIGNDKTKWSDVVDIASKKPLSKLDRDEQNNAILDIVSGGESSENNDNDDAFDESDLPF